MSAYMFAAAVKYSKFRARQAERFAVKIGLARTKLAEDEAATRSLSESARTMRRRSGLKWKQMTGRSASCRQAFVRGVKLQDTARDVSISENRKVSGCTHQLAAKSPESIPRKLKPNARTRNLPLVFWCCPTAGYREESIVSVRWRRERKSAFDAEIFLVTHRSLQRYRVGIHLQRVPASPRTSQLQKSRYVLASDPAFVMSAPARGRLNIESHSHWTLAQSKLPRGHGISQRVSDSTLPRRPTVISTSFGSAGALGIRPPSLRCNDFVVARATSSRLGVQCMRAGMPGTRPSAALAEPHTRISRSAASASATESLALARSRFGARPLHLNIRDLLTACGHRRAVCAIPPLANRRNMLLHFDVVKGGNNKTAHHLLTRMRTCADHALGARHRRCCKLKLKFYQLALPLCHTRGTRGPVSHFDELRTSAPRMIDWDARSYGTVERSCWYWPHPARSRLGCTQQPAGLDIVIAMVVRCVVMACLLSPATRTAGISCPARARQICGWRELPWGFHSGLKMYYWICVFPQRNTTNFRTIREKTGHNSLGRSSRDATEPGVEGQCTITNRNDSGTRV
ncbi:hypothetical protein B0H16DRAFT_1695638 [Mycena metata]|uniref:Uncharacterized protein n=1 Tax=Mycena metata TaxID=1033252 RepID=A0AAD7I6G1_9AGAR|nr:hypothetical protein B0H16DRAFT_1695638 [Mycena metata]